jgi:hypothetical protein
MRPFATFFLLVAMAFAADEPSRAVATTQPTNARFQIVQSEITAKGTFKLDRFTGRVWQLLSTPNGHVWSAMNVQGVKGTDSTVARFQLFSSGLAYRFTYLLDTINGMCWELVSAEDSNDSWQMVLNVE